MKYKLISAFTTNLVLLFLVHTTLAGSIKGNVHLEGSPSNANVLVYIEHVDSSFAAPQKHALMNQKDLMFIPEVLPVLTGTTVDFLNSDNVLHNVFTESKCAGNFILSHCSFHTGCMVPHHSRNFSHALVEIELR